MKPFQNPQVEDVFNTYPEKLKRRLLHLRDLIFETAAQIEAVGELEETLKWGQPSYLTATSKSGTTIRIDRIKANPDRYGMFVHCQTSLVETYRELYPDRLKFDGKRGIIFEENEKIPDKEIRNCIALALTYHLNNRRDRLPF